MCFVLFDVSETSYNVTFNEGNGFAKFIIDDFCK